MCCSARGATTETNGAALELRVHRHDERHQVALETPHASHQQRRVRVQHRFSGVPATDIGNTHRMRKSRMNFAEIDSIEYVRSIYSIRVEFEVSI